VTATALLAMSATARGAWWPDEWYGRMWVLIGFGSEFAFCSRFLVQWIASERTGKSHMPVVFWYLSLLGGMMLLSYSCFWKRDVVIALGQVIGLVVYVRNIMLVRAERAARPAPGGGG
jgi:lipid-A-disaccharide synthase-like uncharacterized protein